MRKLQLVAAAAMIAMSATSAIAQGGGGGGGGGGGRPNAAQMMERMMAGITLSAEQKTKVDSVVAKYAALNGAIARDDADRRTKMMANRTKQSEEIKAILTDDQKKVFDKNAADMAAAQQGGGRPPQR